MFRIASMTKPITSIAALMLVEEGRIALSDPIARHAPEFAQMRVLRSPDGPLSETDAAERPITFEDLLTHRAGLTYADFHRGPIGEAASHGCLRMRVSDAYSLARYLMKQSGAPKDDAWFEQVMEAGKPADVILPRGVPLVIGR